MYSSIIWGIMSVIHTLTRPITQLFGKCSLPKSSAQLGTITGVFIPCILQMIGVILFMRLGWVLGNVGLTTMIAIITLATSIILVTSFSMTSVVTNMKMGGGGSYFLISRSLGPEFGSAVGILLTVSQIVSIALNISGFSYSLHTGFLPWVPLEAIEVVMMIVMTGISYISTNFAIRTQTFILVAIGIALSSIFFGGVSASIGEGVPAPSSLLSVTMGFAMFFPAMVGIEAGMALSGDIKNPHRSLPIGTIAAVFAGFVLYITMAIFEWVNIPRELLIHDPLILVKAAKVGFAVILGIWGATLSSGLGSILAAPRTMQALAEDRVLPRFLAKGHGASNQPRVATLFSFSIAITITLFTNINQLIPILTMVSLVTYTLVNFVSFFESLVKNPSWRPTFRTPWYISLAGSLACVVSMLIINPVASFVVLAMVIGLVVWFSKRAIKGNWEDIRYSVLTYLVRYFTKGLENLDKNAKSWRPNILAVIDPDAKEKNLIRFAHALDQSMGLLTFGTTIPINTNRSHTLTVTNHTLKQYFQKAAIPCFTHVNPFEDPFLGILAMVKNYGMGSLRPNTVLLRHCFENSCPESFAKFLLSSYHMGKNVVILKDQSIEELRTFSIGTPQKKIDVWWGGRYQRNFEFALVVSHILQQSSYWPHAEVQLKTIVRNEADRKALKEKSHEYIARMRKGAFGTSIYLDEEEDVLSQIAQYSVDTNLTILGIRPPHADEAAEAYAVYYMQLIEKTKSLPNVAYVLAGEDIDFDKIFR